MSTEHTTDGHSESTADERTGTSTDERSNSRTEPLNLESGMEALRSSPEFRGPVESIDGHHCNDHFALLYENRTEQFDAIVPFLRHGLERGERCMYVVDEYTQAEIVEAMRDAGVAADAALESGALTFHTVEETYLRNGTFDPDEMIEFYAAAIDEATEEYEALRVVAETTWLQAEATTFEQFMEYEAKINDLFDDEDCIALCQYDRSAFPPQILRDIVRTHPHLIYDGTVCHNFYHTPPEEFFGPDRPDRNVDRMLGTLLDSTVAKTTLEERERYLRLEHEITADPDRTFEEKLQALFELGCERFDLEFGAMARVDPATDRFEIEYVSDERAEFEPGFELPLSETYCAEVVDSGSIAGVVDPTKSGFGDATVRREIGLVAYLGAHVEVDGGTDRTFFFASTRRRESGFSDEECTFLQSMGRWVTHELERRGREDRLAALNTLSRELMDAGTTRDVSEYIVEAAEATLDLPISAVALYDEREGRLVPTSATGAAAELLEGASLLDVGGGIAWNAFVECEAYRTTGSRTEAPPGISEIAVFPLDTHGVFVTCSTTTGGLGPMEFDFAETVAANTEAALDRARREHELHERESLLDEQNSALERLNRINDIIRNIDQALVRASTRSEIEDVVCEELAGDGPYELAWIGDRCGLTNEVSPSEWAGDARGYFDAISFSDDGTNRCDPAVEAIRNREPRVVDNILEKSPSAPWREHALRRGYRSCIALPLVYDESLSGVMAVYATEPNAFGDLEREVLSELSDTIAYAINGVERKKALVGERTVELEFEISDSRHPIVRLVEETNCRFTFEAAVPEPDGRIRAFFAIEGVSATTFRERASSQPIQNLSVVEERHDGEAHECLFEATLTANSFVETIFDHGGSIKRLTGEDGTVSATVELGAGLDVRKFVEMLSERFPDSELVAQRERTRAPTTRREFQAEIRETLTDRQLEALTVAFFSGYFESPRTRNGSDVARTLDVSQPTFNSHMRSAQRKLFTLLFEDGSGTPAGIE